MNARAFRQFKPQHAATAVTGEGARRYGGRWNSRGTPVVYASASLPLGVLELLVHIEAHEVLRAYLVAEVRFDEALVRDIDAGRLPADWRTAPAPPVLRAFGDEWVARGESAVLRVPSALLVGETNYLLNPAHADFSRIESGPARPLALDPRLVKRLPPPR